MEVEGGSALAEDGPVILQWNAPELEGGEATDVELESLAPSRCSSYSYNAADFPRACEIEEFMSPSFQWPASTCASFASGSVSRDNVHRPKLADHPARHVSVFPATKLRFAWWRRRKPDPLLREPDPLSDDPDPAHHVQFSFQELRAATSGFSISNLLGSSDWNGILCNVYKGRLSDGSLVHVKRFGGEGWWSSACETLIMSSTAFPHRNLLQLVGYCVTPTERFIVYPFMANGTVAQWLRERPLSKPPLDWATRIRIALGTARGLSYLHDTCNPRIIHRDVKAENIFLGDNLEPFLGNFEFISLMYEETTPNFEEVRGTIGHIPPECLNSGEVSVKTDVFGYGMMLLELITGQRAFTLAHRINDDITTLKWPHNFLQRENLVPLLDPDLQDNYTDAEKLAQIALLCAQESPVDRLKMSEVVTMLEEIDRPGLAERLVERLQAIVERRKTEMEHTKHRASWSFDSTSDLDPEELSSPR